MSGFNKYNILLLFTFVVTMLFIKTFVVQLYVVEGTSMLPTLRYGDIVLVYKLFYAQKIAGFLISIPGPMKIDKQDIILFETEDSKMLVKRISGLQGDFFIRKNNGAYFADRLRKNQDKVEKIPPEYYLVLGDNKGSSYDSRQIGLIHKLQLRGKVIWIFKD
ncbi:MAG: signal peptidase I [Leptospiraceae bacterium]|nr:signal peptidase I [Leptospiraceae bacterium]MCP5496281.1 signal peptidase I [Leptospiraceae bacterium]